MPYFKIQITISQMDSHKKKKNQKNNYDIYVKNPHWGDSREPRSLGITAITAPTQTTG